MADYIKDYNSAASSAINNYNAAIDAGLQAQKLSYDNQKQEALAQQKKANTAAQQTYLQSINPYGYNAQQLAGLGLSRSGISESSRINAGNTYSNNLNAARDNYNSSVRQANLAYQQAQLQAAEDKGKYAADTTLSGSQWAAEYALKKAELDEQVANNKISRAQAQAELDVYLKYAMQQAAADLEATKASTKKTLSGI